MRMVIFGGDARMQGAIAAAERAGWETERLSERTDFDRKPEQADAVLLPWPTSFEGGHLVTAAGEKPTKQETLACLPECDLILYGRGVEPGELPEKAVPVVPGRDEAFLVKNARLTAEGALCTAMQRGERPICGSVCLITGFGRIGRELAARLAAMGAFTIVCARNEGQMQQAHRTGAHPVPLSGIAGAVGSADFIFNTIPARVMDGECLSRIRKDAMLLELASPPYGMDVEEAVRMGLRLLVLGGMPARYAPGAAGEALFEAMQRGWTQLCEKRRQAQ